jgi:hypothetical protein
MLYCIQLTLLLSSGMWLGLSFRLQLEQGTQAREILGLPSLVTPFHQNTMIYV